MQPDASALERFLFYQKYYWDYCWQEIQVLSISNPFLFMLMCLAIAFGLEMILPKVIKYDRLKRKGFWLDWFYVFFYDFIIIFIGLFAVTNLLDHYFFQLLGNFGLTRENIIIYDLANASIWLKVIVLFVLVDFMEWLAHFLMHRFDFLWAFHKIHHAQEEIGVASSRHFHIGEYFVFRPLAYMPFIFLGYAPHEYTIYTTFIFVFLAFFTHANAKIPLGPLNYIFNSPNTHIWHHAQNVPYKYGVNFASALNIWDVLFGFYYLPKEEEQKTPVLGVWDMDEVPKTFLGQFIYPFKYWFTTKWKTNEFDEIPKAYKQEVKKKKRKGKK